MTTAQKQRITDLLLDQVQERNLAAEWWRRNASVRHGVPYAEAPPKINLTVSDERKEPQGQSPPAQEQPPAEHGRAWPKWLERLLWSLLGAGLALALGAVAYQGFMLFAEDEPGNGSLYQYLEDNGYHVPE